jgi:hypothetical protein
MLPSRPVHARSRGRTAISSSRCLLHSPPGSAGGEGYPSEWVLARRLDGRPRVGDACHRDPGGAPVDAPRRMWKGLRAGRVGTLDRWGPSSVSVGDLGRNMKLTRTPSCTMPVCSQCGEMEAQWKPSGSNQAARGRNLQRNGANVSCGAENRPTACAQTRWQ